MTNKEVDESAGDRINRRAAIAGTAFGIGMLAANPLAALATAVPEITRTSAAIHQRRTFSVAPARVYDALTDATAFHAVTLLSGAMKAGMPAGAKPTAISREPGGSFTLFGGVITGRQIELVPAERIVQAWRDDAWKPGMYSLVRFELSPSGAGTLLTFDHRAFPDADARHLADGWQANYWGPLAAYLSKNRS